MSKFISWLKSLFFKPSIKIEPIPKVNVPETPKAEPNPIAADKPKIINGYVLGVDVSHHNKNVDCKAIKAAGYSFAYVKATEGKTFVSPKFHENVKKAKAAGLKVGAYHFMRQNIDPVEQAQFFLNKIKDQDLDMIPVCDWESHDGAGEAQQYANVKKFLDYIEQKLGKKPLIYTGKWFIDQVEAKDRSITIPSWLAQYPLWISDYGVNRTYPRMPKPWTEYAIWQFTESGTIPGISPGKFDLNRVTPEQYKKLLN